MPHDRNGKELRAGDLVTLTARLKAVHLTEDECNVDAVVHNPGVQPVLSGRDWRSLVHLPEFTLNSRLVEKVEPTEQEEKPNG